MTLLCVLALKRLLAAGQALSSKTSSNITFHSLYDTRYGYKGDESKN